MFKTHFDGLFIVVHDLRGILAVFCDSFRLIKVPDGKGLCLKDDAFNSSVAFLRSSKGRMPSLIKKGAKEASFVFWSDDGGA